MPLPSWPCAGGRVEGIDYRGVRVLASLILPVPDSSWFLVAKEDRAEVFAEWRFRRNLMLAVFLTLVGALMAVGLAVWQRSRKAHYQALYAAESQLRMGMERFSITLKSIGDAVIATDVQGRVRFQSRGRDIDRLVGWRGPTPAARRGLPHRERRDSKEGRNPGDEGSARRHHCGTGQSHGVDRPGWFSASD